MSLRISTNIMLFIIFLNATVGAAGAAGIWTDMGVQVESGVNDQVQQFEAAASEVTAGGFGVSTLAAMYLAAASFFGLGFSLVTAAPNVIGAIIGAGPVAVFIGDLFSVIAVVIVARDIYSILTGGVR